MGFESQEMPMWIEDGIFAAILNSGDSRKYDRKVDLHQFTAAGGTATQFAALDKDATGFITFEQIQLMEEEIVIEAQRQVIEAQRQVYASDFARFDKDGDGLLDLSEVEELLKFQLEQSTVSAEQLKQYFAELDTDLDGKVSLAEYIASIEKKRIDPAKLEAFKQFDRNGSGFIDKNELKAHFDDEDAQDIIDSCDVDGDGKINIEEFLAS